MYRLLRFFGIFRISHRKNSSDAFQETNGTATLLYSNETSGVSYVVNDGLVTKNDIEEVCNLPFSLFSPITERVYITSFGGITRRNIEKYKIQCIFDFSKEVSYDIPGIKHRKFKDFLDRPYVQIDHLFDEVADEINSFAENGQNVVLHCFAGAGRSATLLIAYLMKYKQLSLRDAFILLRKQRPIVKPNNGFFAQLIEYEKKLRGEVSVKMVKSTKTGEEVVDIDMDMI